MERVIRLQPPCGADSLLMLILSNASAPTTFDTHEVADDLAFELEFYLANHIHSDIKFSPGPGAVSGTRCCA